MSFFKRLNFSSYVVIIISFFTLLFEAEGFLPFWSFEASIFSKSVLVSTTNFYGDLMHYFYNNGWFSFAGLRYLHLIPIFLMVLISVIAIQKIFNFERASIFLLVLISQPLFLVYGKIITCDAWVGLLQTIIFFWAILYTKKQYKLALIGMSLSLFILSFINFQLFLITGIGVYLLLFKKENFSILIFCVLVIGLLVYQFLMDTAIPFFLFQYLFFDNTLLGLGLLFFGTFPWLPFLGAGLVDSFKKINRNDEFSAIILIGFFIGLGSLSPLTNIVASLLITKHLIDYGKKNYPYQSFVKGILASTAVILFIGCIGSTFFIFSQIGEIGFRTMSSVSLAIWIPQILSMIMIYGKNTRYIHKTLSIGGAIIGFVLITFLASLYYDYYLGIQDRILSFCEDENISTLALEPNGKNIYLNQMLTARLKNASIKFKDGSRYRITYKKRIKVDSHNKIYNFENISTFFTKDSIYSTLPIFYEVK